MCVRVFKGMMALSTRGCPVFFFFFRYCSHTHHLLSTLSIPTLVSGRQLSSRADKSGHCTDRRQRNVVSQQLARIKGAGRFFPQTFAMAQVALPLCVRARVRLGWVSLLSTMAKCHQSSLSPPLSSSLPPFVSFVQCADHFMKIVGLPFLHDTLKSVIDDIFHERKDCEIDPTKVSMLTHTNFACSCARVTGLGVWLSCFPALHDVSFPNSRSLPPSLFLPRLS